MIELARVSVTLGGKKVLDGIDWELRSGEHWVVTGPNGAGKTTLLRVIRGEQWIDRDRGRRVYRFLTDDDDLGTARALIGYLSPELHEKLLRMELSLTVRELIAGGLVGTLYLAAALTRTQRERVERIAASLSLQSILEEPMSSLSFGQLRRALLARALVGEPEVLVLDEFSHGIDRQSRKLIHAALGAAAASGTALILATHRTDELPEPITHELRIERGRIVRQGPFARRPRRGRTSAGGDGADEGGAEGPVILRLSNVDVFADGRRVLYGINWEVRASEHWFVSGPNGAGKTTLGKLLFGRLRAAYGGTVERFSSNEHRGVAQIRREVALISDEEQLRYDWSIPVESVVASGFFHSVGLMQAPSEQQLRTARELIADFGIEHLAKRPFLELSFGERRMVLVARALVRTPRLLILDEALNGFDKEARSRILRRVETLAAGGTSVVMIGHHDDDVPEWIANELQLDGGRVIDCRRRERP